MVKQFHYGTILKIERDTKYPEKIALFQTGPISRPINGKVSLHHLYIGHTLTKQQKTYTSQETNQVTGT